MAHGNRPIRHDASGQGGTEPIVYESAKQIAARVGVSERTVRRWIAAGKLVPHRAGRLVRFKREDVDALLVPAQRRGGGDA